MATTATLRIQVEANTRGLDKLRGQLSRSTKQSGGLRTSLGGLTRSLKVVAAAAIASAAALTASVVALGAIAKRGQQVINVQTAFNRATGDGVRSIKLLKEATSGLVDEYTLMEQANTALTLGSADNVEQFAKLANTAQELGRALGLDAAFALNSLNIGIARQSKLILDNLGIMVSIEDANQKYADSLDRTVKSLTDSEKKEAFRVEAMRQADVALKRLGKSGATAGDMWVEFTATVKNIKDEFAELVAGSSTVQDFFTELGDIASDVLKVLKADTDTMREAFAELGTLTGTAFKAAFLKAGVADLGERGIVGKVTGFLLGPLIDGIREMAEAAEEELRLSIERMGKIVAAAKPRVDGFGDSAKTAAEILEEMGIAATLTKDDAQDMTLAILRSSVAFEDQIAGSRRATGALRTYNEELNNTEQALLGIASALGRLAGGGGLFGFLKTAASIGAAIAFPGVGGLAASSAIASFDSGGSIPSGGVGIVGERGPELVSGPANVTSRSDTASMMGGDANFTFIFEQEGVEVRRISKKIKRNDSLGNSLRLALPAPVVG